MPKARKGAASAASHRLGREGSFQASLSISGHRSPGTPMFESHRRSSPLASKGQADCEP